MLPNDPHCFGHPTKVTFTFADRGLKANCGVPASSFWTGQPYRDQPGYDIQKWLAHKTRGQKEKMRIERAVQRAEKKLQDEYDKQMVAQREAAQKRFKAWLKCKGFANQAPVMLQRELVPVQKVNSAPPSAEWSRAKTAKTMRTPSRPDSRLDSRPDSRLQNKISQSAIKAQRPKSASSALNRKRISSTLDIKKPAPPTKPCKALCSEEYMKMKHLAGKRYKKLKEEKLEFQCEDQLLRKLQNLEWEEKCIKNKMIFSEKDDLEKIKSRALRRRKKKLKFKGDLITIEVEELDDSADVEILFEEVDDQCSDIGCIEKEGVDFHIESRETIDLDGVETAVNSRQNMTLPPSPPPPVLQQVCQEQPPLSAMQPTAPPTTPRPATAAPPTTPRPATAEPPRPTTAEPPRPTTAEPPRPTTAEPPRAKTAEPPRAKTAEPPKSTPTEPGKPTALKESPKQRPKTASSENERNRRQKEEGTSVPKTIPEQVEPGNTSEAKTKAEVEAEIKAKAEVKPKAEAKVTSGSATYVPPPTIVIDTADKTKIIVAPEKQKIDVFVKKVEETEVGKTGTEKADNEPGKPGNAAETAVKTEVKAHTQTNGAVITAGTAEPSEAAKIASDSFFD